MLCYTTNNSCDSNQSEDQRKSISQLFAKRDTSLIVVIPYDTSYNWMFKNAQQYNLTDKDYILIEDLLTESINKENPKLRKQFQELKARHPKLIIEQKDFVLDIKKYKRQYLAVVDKDGEKKVWIHCFCGDYNSDKISLVKNGGTCETVLVVNISTKKVIHFTTGGYS